MRPSTRFVAWAIIDLWHKSRHPVRLVHLLWGRGHGTPCCRRPFGGDQLVSKFRQSREFVQLDRCISGWALSLELVAQKKPLEGNPLCLWE